MTRWALVGLALLSACSLAPQFTQPEVEVPAAYKEDDPSSASWQPAHPHDGVARGAWWEAFEDPELNALEIRAQTANQDLPAALARVASSRATLGITRADQVPRIDLGAGASRVQPSNVQPGLPGDTTLDPYNDFQASLGASYELDLFGRVRDSVRAATAEVGVQEALYQSLLLTLQADVAETYFLIRAADAELAVLQATVAVREDTVRVFERQMAAGDISELDLARARSDLELARSDAYAVERQRAQYEHALALLLGSAPASFVLAPRPQMGKPPAIPAGVPSTLLQRRPDIAAAQRRMTAANARIGVAKAAFYPVLNLTAEFGVETDTVGELFKWGSRTWALGPVAGSLLVLPLFDGGRNRANLARAEAELDGEIANYRQTVLAAFAEVEDQLVGLRTLTAQDQALTAADVAAARALKVADLRYEAGATGYLDVLDARRTLTSVRRQHVQLIGARATTTVALVRALGGSW